MTGSGSVVARLRRFLVEDLGVSHGHEVGRTASLVDSGVIDSLTVAKLIAFIEAEYGVVLDLEDVVAENFETLERIADLVATRSLPSRR
jgi:acyl carrier protein